MRAELLMFGVLAFNVLQAAYALKYPRAPLPLPPTPAKSSKGTPLSPPARQWRLQGLTPTVRDIALYDAGTRHDAQCNAVQPSTTKGVLNICSFSRLDPITNHQLHYP